MGQEQWAAWLGVSRKTVQRWEAGDAVPDAKAEQAILDVCHERAVVTSTAALRTLLAEARLDRARVPHARLPADQVVDDGLVGRDADVDAVRSACAITRLVTLVGPAGVGKTRLAGAAAAPEGVAVPLAPVRDAAMVLPAIAAALSVRQVAGRSLRDAIVAALARPALLVVDNCEHLPEVAPVVGDLLRSAPALRVVATSRRPLHLPGEHVFTVQPLALDAAVTLFERAAGEVAPGFAVDDEARPVVARLCERLDGLPLAIRLAAARTRVLSPAAILERLDHRLELLVDRTAVAAGADRHRSVRAALEWSHELLEPDERRLFRRLGVFTGAFGVDAVEAVFENGDAVAVVDAMESMLDHNLVQRSDVRGAEPQFFLLETVRTFAADQLDVAGEDASARRAHASHYATFAANAAAELHGPSQVTWIGRIDASYDNVRSALTWLLDHDADAAIGMAIALASYWDAKSAFSEGREWLARALAAADPAQWIAAGTGSTWASYLAALQGDFGEAERLASSALALWDEHGAVQGRGYAQLMLGFVAVERGDLDAGEQLLTASLAALEEAGDRWGSARPLNNLGEIARMRGDVARAGELHARALAISRDLGDLGSQPNMLCGLGHVSLLDGQAGAARELAREAIEISELLGNRLGIAAALELLGLATLDADAPRAVRILAAAASLRSEMGVPIEARDVHLVAGAIDRGRSLLGNAFDTAWSAGASASPGDFVDPPL